MDASQARSRIRVATQWSSEKGSNWAGLRIQDYGTGMNDEAKRHAFDVFFSTKTRGMGLGLPVVASIVKEHGGSITFVTAEGRGTTFDIVFPIGGGR